MTQISSWNSEKSPENHGSPMIKAKRSDRREIEGEKIMNVFTVAILQSVAAIVWIIMLFIARNAISIALALIFTFMAVSTWVSIIKAMKK